MQDLFGDLEADQPRAEKLAPGALLLRGRALPMEKPILAALDEILAAGALSPDDHAGRIRDVGGHDELRRGGLGHRPARLSL